MENGKLDAVYGGDRTLAILVHVSGIFFGFVVPLVLFLIKKDTPDEFSKDNAREALNFQITVLIYYIACFVLSFILIGIFLFWIAMLLNLVLCIVAAVKASNGFVYRYPLTIRLVNG